MSQETNTQSETKSSLVNDIEYIGTDIRSAYNRMDSKEAEALQEYIYAGERLEELKKKVKKAKYNWKEWGPEYFGKSYSSLNNNIKFSKWCAKQKSAAGLHFLQMSEKNRLIVIENFKTVEEVNEFFADSGRLELHRSSLRKAIKIYKGEVSSEENSGKGATPTEDNQPDTETVDVTALENKVSALRMKNSIQKKKIKQLQTENQRLRDENRVLNERDDASLSDADRLYEHSKFYRTYADNHSGDICIGFDDYVEKRLEEARQEAIDKYKENEAYNAY